MPDDDVSELDLQEAVTASSVWAADSKQWAVQSKASAGEAAGAGDRLRATSSSLVTAGIGMRVFTIQRRRLFAVGDYVLIKSATGPLALSMGARVVTYVDYQLTVNVESVVGTGAANSWEISISGAPGAKGNTGDVSTAPGPPGPPPSLSIGTVTTGAAGSSATVSFSGAPPNYVLSFLLPKGDTGAAGAGSGTVTHTGSPANNEVALFSGTSGDIIKSGGALANLAFTANWTDVTGKPTFVPVATSGLASDLSGTLNAAQLPNDGVTNARLANVPTGTFKARLTTGAGDPEDLIGTQATTLLDVFVGDSGSGGTKGLVPPPAAGDAAAGKFVSAYGDFRAPSLIISIARSTKTANYTTVTGDRGKLIEATSGSATLSLLAAATATGGFAHKFKNSGPGVWTIDPNGSETIDGRTTILVYPGEAFELVSDGSNWFTIGRQRLVLINSTVISGSPTSIDWTLGLADPEIDVVSFDLRGVTLSADGIFACRFGPSGGVYTSDYEYSGPVGTGTNVTYVGSSAASSIVLGFAAKRIFAGRLELLGLNALAAKTPVVDWKLSAAAAASATAIETTAGLGENGVGSGSALATFRLMTTTGTPTFASGTISQWGRRA